MNNTKEELILSLQEKLRNIRKEDNFLEYAKIKAEIKVLVKEVEAEKENTISSIAIIPSKEISTRPEAPLAVQSEKRLLDLSNNQPSENKVEKNNAERDLLISSLRQQIHDFNAKENFLEYAKLKANLKRLLIEVANDNNNVTCENVPTKIEEEVKEDVVEPTFKSTESMDNFDLFETTEENNSVDTNKIEFENAQEPFSFSDVENTTTTVEEPSFTDVNNTTTEEPSFTNVNNTKVEELSFTDVNNTTTEEPSFTDVNNTTVEEPSFTDVNNTKVEEPSFTNVNNTTTEEPSFTNVNNTTVEEPSFTDVNNTKVEEPSFTDVNNTTVEEPSFTDVNNTTAEEPSFTDVNNTTAEEPSFTNVNNTTVEEPSFTNVNNTTTEEPSFTNVNNTTVEEPSFTDVNNTTVEEPSFTDVNNTTAEEPSFTNVNNNTVEEPSFTDVNNTTAEEPSFENFKSEENIPSFSEVVKQATENADNVEVVHAQEIPENNSNTFGDNNFETEVSKPVVENTTVQSENFISNDTITTNTDNNTAQPATDLDTPKKGWFSRFLEKLSSIFRKK